MFGLHSRMRPREVQFTKPDYKALLEPIADRTVGALEERAPEPWAPETYRILPLSSRFRRETGGRVRVGRLPAGIGRASDRGAGSRWEPPGRRLPSK